MTFKCGAHVVVISCMWGVITNSAWIYAILPGVWQNSTHRLVSKSQLRFFDYSCFTSLKIWNFQSSVFHSSCGVALEHKVAGWISCSIVCLSVLEEDTDSFISPATKGSKASVLVALVPSPNKWGGLCPEGHQTWNLKSICRIKPLWEALGGKKTTKDAAYVSCQHVLKCIKVKRFVVAFSHQNSLSFEQVRTGGRSVQNPPSSSSSMPLYCVCNRFCVVTDRHSRKKMQSWSQYIFCYKRWIKLSGLRQHHVRLCFLALLSGCLSYCCYVSLFRSNSTHMHLWTSWWEKNRQILNPHNHPYSQLGIIIVNSIEASVSVQTFSLDHFLLLLSDINLFTSFMALPWLLY